MQELVKLYKLSELGNRLLAYDGRRTFYTAGPLSFTSKEFVIKLKEQNDGTSRLRLVQK